MKTRSAEWGTVWGATYALASAEHSSSIVYIEYLDMAQVPVKIWAAEWGFVWDTLPERQAPAATMLLKVIPHAH